MVFEFVTMVRGRFTGRRNDEGRRRGAEKHRILDIQ